MELHAIYPPYANLSPPSPAQNYHSTFPSLPHWVWHLPATCLPPVSRSISPSLVSLCVSLRRVKKKKKKRPPLVVPLECWVGEKYRLQPELFPFFQQSFHYAYHFQVQHQTLEGWQSARGKIISVVLQAYLKMHFNTFVASQPVSTATRYIKLQNTSNFITFHIQLT